MDSTGLLNYSATLSGGYREQYRFVRGPVPTPGVAEAVVRIDFSGVCHGDVYTRDGGGPAPTEPIRPLVGGHEGIGEIVFLGKEDAQDSGFSVGDIVGIAWRGRVCKECEPCELGAENYCVQQQIVGMHRNGTFQRSYLHTYLRRAKLTNFYRLHFIPS